MRQDEFIIEPANPQMRCTPVSVAAHTLYENADPFLLYEPSGWVLCDDATKQWIQLPLPCNPPGADAGDAGDAEVGDAPAEIGDAGADDAPPSPG